MDKKHGFNFKGGLELSKMGATWFTSYMYYLNIDKNHRNWTNCSTIEMRTSFFYGSRKYHKFWLENIVNMDSGRLSSNKLDLNGQDVIRMAKQILKIYC